MNRVVRTVSMIVLASACGACSGGSTPMDGGSDTIATFDAHGQDTAPLDSSTTHTDVTTTADTSVDATGPGTDTGPPADVGPTTLVFTASDRTITSSGVSRTFVLARPQPMSAGLPLVFSLHPDGGDGPSFRTAMSLESAATRPMVYVYPSAPGGTFEYYTLAGRAHEAQFVQDVIALLSAELGIDTGHVYVTGMSGGATMSNAILCHLPAGVIHGVGIHSGTLYPQDDPPGSGMNVDFTYTTSGGVSCPLPAAIFVWGELDRSDVSFMYGQATRDNYRANLSCASSADSPWTHTPCVAYAGCDAPVVWCPIPGLAHALWPGAAGVIQPFFESL